MEEQKFGNVYKMLVSFLLEMKQEIPIVFDRYTNVNNSYEIYGWIKRKDGQRDFVVFSMYLDVDDSLEGTFVTSSAKWSKKIYEKMYGETSGHNDCQPIDKLINMAGI